MTQKFCQARIARAGHAAQVAVARLDTITENVVTARSVVGHIAACSRVLIAGVGRAIDTIIAGGSCVVLASQCLVAPLLAITVKIVGA